MHQIPKVSNPPALSASRKNTIILKASEVRVNSQLAAHCYFHGTQSEAKIRSCSLLNSSKESHLSASIPPANISGNIRLILRNTGLIKQLI